MNKTQLIKNIEEMELKLKEMIEELETIEEKSFPQKNDKYYYINRYGIINSNTATDSDGRFQAFKTYDEAKKFYDVECARQRVKDEIKRLNEGWTPDWTDRSQPKCFTRLVEDKLAIENYKYSKDLDNSMYLRSYDLANKLINSHEDDLLLILGQ